MNTIIDLVLTPEEAFDTDSFQQVAAEKLNLLPDQQFRPLKRSIDARSRKVIVRLQGEVINREQALDAITYQKPERDVSLGKRVVIIGAGPAGLFAALRLLEAGIKPIVLERGKDVQARRRDLVAINKDHVVNPHSNYCFGEGGAGTYSDGKLYTRSTKRGNVRKILESLVIHGAPSEILYDAHPHIGTNRLPQLIQQIRSTILECGGEILFNTHVTDFVIAGDQLQAVVTATGEQIAAESFILATGHSARDVFELLSKKQILIEPKPFAVGVRVEHEQKLIDSIQYHCTGPRDPYLPASSYALVSQVPARGKERGVFSFCMCPGGFIVPAATAPGEIVVNGMSPSRRDSRFSNSGIVVAVDLADLGSYAKYGPLGGVYFQRDIEQKAWEAGGKTQRAPAQRLLDFVNGNASSTLLDTSYQPGLTSANLAEVLPSFVAESLKTGFRNFGVKMKGYVTNEAQVVGVESRTSSPVRIPRNPDTLEHPQVCRLFPCGEGAGYAGGIVSAAIDGERCAEALINKYVHE
ncbi:MAG: NAD(P)/FAD-dependent oxidoreductase [Cytophagales bacterium]|nr:NAD(P)/FAD-dependent oxidoreductase [Cytophagales bacterium]